MSRIEDDAALATRLCDRLGLPLRHSELGLEGGAISLDGEGTILTTESCVLNPNRNPGITRIEAERELCHALGDEPARQIVEQAFPSRKVVQVDVRDIAIGGGGIHCITRQQPA